MCTVDQPFFVISRKKDWERRHREFVLRCAIESDRLDPLPRATIAAMVNDDDTKRKFFVSKHIVDGVCLFVYCM
jgi:hypothetical protein